MGATGDVDVKAALPRLAAHCQTAMQTELDILKAVHHRRNLEAAIGLLVNM